MSGIFFPIISDHAKSSFNIDLEIAFLISLIILK